MAASWNFPLSSDFKSSVRFYVIIIVKRQSLTLGSYRHQSKRDDGRNTAIQHTTQIQLQWIGHFRATKYLCFKTSPSATPFISKRFWFIWKWTFRVNSFSYEWFRTKIYFDIGKTANRKWPILLPSIICAIWTTIHTIYIFQDEFFG